MGSPNARSGLGVEAGLIAYGNQTIDQRVRNTPVGQDYMQTFADWLNVQNGANVRLNTQLFAPGARFIHTPRDLATFVHDDQLYQAYLNACLILLNMRSPLDANFSDLLAGSAPGSRTTGFALFGGPHILSLVTEIATRALKAVRYQKFNIHLRARPEALAARIAKAADVDAAIGGRLFADFAATVGDVVSATEEFNEAAGGERLALLPMAFQEGSPMHPTYGAGHATVAGACVTILKAFFDLGDVGAGEDALLDNPTALYRTPAGDVLFKRYEADDTAVQYVTTNGGDEIVMQEASQPLTLEGELNKRAANILIGRNMAGVHYYSDYYDSVRMGEEIAIGMLQEQALCYPKDRFTLSLRTFSRGGHPKISHPDPSTCPSRR